MTIDWTQMKTAEQLAEEARKAAVPQVISRAQGKATLKLAGLWDGAMAFVETLSGPQRILADAALNDAGEWRRDSEFLQICAAGLSLSDLDLDNLFTQAGQIKL